MRVKSIGPLLLVIIYCMLIFVLSSQPGVWVSSFKSEFYFIPNNFLLHIVEYGILGALLRIASTDIPTISLFSAFYGVTDEIHQWFIPFRVMDPYDILANSMGGILGIALVHAREEMKK